MNLRVSEAPTESMPPKLDAKSKTERVHIVAPRSMLTQIDEWRAHQRPLPTLSHAIRRLVEIGLKSEGVVPVDEAERV